MRLIDADVLPISFDGHTISVWKKDLDAAPTVNPYEWISVEDRLPDMDCLPMYCIVAAKVGDKVVVDFAERYRSWNSKGEVWANWEIFHDWDEGQGCEITHWMPLPAPPTEKEN